MTRLLFAVWSARRPPRSADRGAEGRDTTELHRISHPEAGRHRKACESCRWQRSSAVRLIRSSTPRGRLSGIDAEERGQAEAIARNLGKWLGCGSSDFSLYRRGAWRRAGPRVGQPCFHAGDAVYQCDFPESCAAIIWRMSNESRAGSGALRMTRKIYGLGLVDGIIPEPPGGAS